MKEIWHQCLDASGGPYLFGKKPTVADAMYAPVCTRFHTYSVELDKPLQAYVETIRNWSLMQEWSAGARAEPDEIVKLEVEF